MAITKITHPTWSPFSVPGFAEDEYTFAVCLSVVWHARCRLTDGDTETWRA